MIFSRSKDTMKKLCRNIHQLIFRHSAGTIKNSKVTMVNQINTRPIKFELFSAFRNDISAKSLTLLFY